MNHRAWAASILTAALMGCGPNVPSPEPVAPAFMVGGDVSFLPEIEEHGGRYADQDGSRDLLVLMRDHGFNTVRLKLWHTPAGSYNTLTRVLGVATRARGLGMQLLLDIHYSDDWADPAKQFKPRAWEGLDFGTLVDSVYRYSHDVVAALSAQGTPPAMVQIGNEIRPGLLWPDGRVDGEWDTPAQWKKLATLLQAGRKGVLDASPGHPPLVMVHFDNGAKNAMGRTFFDHLVAEGVDFDVIGLSFYSKWHGTVDELRFNLADLASRYGKDVYVVETAYPWTMEWADGAGNIFGTDADLHAGYPPTVEGQAAFLRAVRAAVEDVPDGRGGGVVYWAPEWIPVRGVPSAWENATLFDFQGKALPSMDAFTKGR